MIYSRKVVLNVTVAAAGGIDGGIVLIESCGACTLNGSIAGRGRYLGDLLDRTFTRGATFSVIVMLLSPPMEEVTVGSGRLPTEFCYVMGTSPLL